MYLLCSYASENNTRELKIPEINCYLLSEPVSKDRKYYTALEDKRSCCLLFMRKVRFITTQKRISSDFFLIKVKYCGIHINIRTSVFRWQLGGGREQRVISQWAGLNILASGN